MFRTGGPPRHRAGFGDASIGEFQTLMGNVPGVPGVPDFQTSWGAVQSQLQAEGVPISSDQYLGAQLSFTDAFKGLAQVQGVGEQIGNAAANFTLIGQTAAGAYQTITSLAQTVTSGTPQQIVQAFTGTLISTGIAVGAVSAGVGAAITIGVGLVLEALHSVFSPPPSGVQIMPGCYVSWDASQIPFSIGYLVFTTPDPNSAKVSPTARGSWRRFPAPSSAWFQTRSALQANLHQNPRPLSVTGGYFFWCDQAPDERPIDLAFPEFRYLECYTAQPYTNDFDRAFFAAWKANKEYALNGLMPQPDWQVFAHAARLWNLSHEPATHRHHPQWYGDMGQSPSFFTGDCPSYLLQPYYAYLAGDVLQNVSDPLIVESGFVKIHTGPAKTFAPVLTTGSGPTGGSSTAQKVAVGTAVVGGAAVAGIGLYAYLKQQAFSTTVNNLWGTIAKPLRR